jgi:hypothetical protein
MNGAGEGTAIRASEGLQLREAIWQEFDLSEAKSEHHRTLASIPPS